MPKISIILPCFKVEKYLSRAINSVLNQTFSNFELLVIIDGSPDNSLTIAKKFALEDSRIIVLEKENGGLSDTRNYGLERAIGEFIYFMDSDDWIEPDLLEDNIKILEDNSLDFIIFGYFQDYEDIKGNLMISNEVLPVYDQFNKGQTNILDTHHIGLMGYVWNKIYRRTFLFENNLRFEKGISLVEDILFNLPIYSLSKKIRFNRKAYYHYLNRPVVTLMRKFHKDSFKLIKNKNNSIYFFLKKWNITNRNELLSDLLVQGIRYCIHNLFSSKNQLGFYKKVLKIQEMYEDEMTVKYINVFRPKNLKDEIYKFLIQNKLAYLTALIVKLIK